MQIFFLSEWLSMHFVVGHRLTVAIKYLRYLIVKRLFLCSVLADTTTVRLAPYWAFHLSDDVLVSTDH